MFIPSFFAWWYGHGWGLVANSFRSRLKGVIDEFSVSQLAHTLFAPWRRIITYPGASLQARFRAWGDNMFSRVVGFFVRFFVLIAALISVLLVTVFTAIELIVWPLLPVAIPVFIIMGLV